MVKKEDYTYKADDRRAFHKMQGVQQIAARSRPIWNLYATEANMDNRAPMFKKEQL